MSGQPVVLRRLVRNVVAKEVGGVRPLVNLDCVGEGTGDLVATNLEQSAAQQNVAAEAGDVLYGKLRPYLRKVLAVERPVFASGEFLCLRPLRQEVDSGWLKYVALSDHWTDFAVSSAYGAKMPRTSWDQLAELPLVVPSVQEQRRIAAFLDHQIQRLDAIIKLRQHQAEVARLRPWADFCEELTAQGHELVPFRRFLRFITDGPFGSAFTSAQYVQDGHPVVRLGNIGFAEYRSADTACVPSELFAKFPRCHVQTGDLLIASLGDERNHAGRATLAPAMARQAMVKGKCFCARVDLDQLDPDFMAILLSSPLGSETLTRFGQGATRQMINIETVKASAWPVPDLEAQRALRSRFREAQSRSSALADTLFRSSELLQERKRALISVAVTGELEVTTASGRGVA